MSDIVLSTIIDKIISKTSQNLKKINLEETQTFIKAIQDSKRIFNIGQGRSALIAENFAIRLLQLGFSVSVVSEHALDIAPPVGGNGDLVIAISGSGETEEVITYCKIAKKKGAKIAVVTSFKESSLAKIADYIVIVGGRSKRWKYKTFIERELSGEAESVSIEGALFEISTMILIEAIIQYIQEEKKNGK